MDRAPAPGHVWESVAINGGGDTLFRWRRPDGGAPVVRVDKFGDLLLLADSVSQWLKLLGVGWGAEGNSCSLWEYTDEPEHRLECQQAAERLRERVGPLVGEPSALMARARRVHPDPATGLVHTEPAPDIPRLGWWHRSAELAPVVTQLDRGDWAAGVAHMEAALRDREDAGLYRLGADCALNAGRLELAAMWARRGDDPERLWTALQRLGRTDDLLELCRSRIAAEPQPDGRWLERLHEVADDVQAQMMPLDRRLRPWARQAALLTPELSRSRRREIAERGAERWWRWPLGHARFCIEIARAHVDALRPREAREALERAAPVPEVEADRAALLVRIDELERREGPSDPVEALQLAWKSAEDGRRGEAGARCGFALLEAGRRPEAWEPLEDAAMLLPHDHPLTKRVFAALDALESEGHAR